MKREKQLKIYAADDAWAAACAVQRINGSYLKFEQRNEKNEIIRRANKVALRSALNGNLSVTDEDREEGKKIRRHFQTLLFRVLAGQINSYLQSAVQIAARDEFSSEDHLPIAILASLPSAYARDIATQLVREKKSELSSSSRHIGKLDETLKLTVVVLDSHYSQQWNTFYVNGHSDGNLVFFPYRERLATGTVLDFVGTVKSHRDQDTCTQFNHVHCKAIAT